MEHDHLDDLNSQLGELIEQIAEQGLHPGELLVLQQQAAALHARIRAEQQRIRARLVAEVQGLRDQARRREQRRVRGGGGSDSGDSVDALEGGRRVQQEFAGGEAGEGEDAAAAVGQAEGGVAGEDEDPAAAAAGQAGDQELQENVRGLLEVAQEVYPQMFAEADAQRDQDAQQERLRLARSEWARRDFGHDLCCSQQHGLLICMCCLYCQQQHSNACLA